MTDELSAEQRHRELMKRFALRESAAPGRILRWRNRTDLLMGIGGTAAVVGIIAGIVATLLRYPADCDATYECTTHTYAALGVALTALSTVGLMVVLLLGRLSKAMPALFLATGASEFLPERRHTRTATTADVAVPGAPPDDPPAVVSPADGEPPAS